VTKGDRQFTMLVIMVDQVFGVRPCVAASSLADSVGSLNASSTEAIPRSRSMLVPTKGMPTRLQSSRESRLKDRLISRYRRTLSGWFDEADRWDAVDDLGK
jgi:hypothetical protein